MAIRCSDCGREYDVALFQFGRTVRCSCGREVRAGEPHREKWTSEKDRAIEEEREKVRKFQRLADGISRMILTADYPEIDIELAKGALREECQRLFPDRMELFELIYESRFRRLWEQFRGES